MSLFFALTVPVLIFLGIVVPIRLTFHYITLWMRMRGAGAAGAAPAGAAGGAGGAGGATAHDDDDDELERLRELAERLERRVDSLETILDAEVPDWRHK